MVVSFSLFFFVPFFVVIGRNFMFNFIFKIFKRKKEIKDKLDEALGQGLITNEEFLRLRCDRADTKLKEYLKEKK